MSKTKGRGLLKKLAESFAAKLKERSQTLRPGEAIGLKLPGRAAPKAVKHVAVTLRGADELVLKVTWLDTSVEEIIYGPNEFKPTLHRIDMNPLTAEPLPRPDPPQVLSPAAEKQLIENMVGQITGIAALEAMFLASRANASGTPAKMVGQERASALRVLETAQLTVPGLDTDAIRTASRQAIERHYGSVKLHAQEVS